MVENLPGFYTQSKNINKVCKFCIQSKKIALESANIFLILQNYARCITPRGQNNIDKSIINIIINIIIMIIINIIININIIIIIVAVVVVC